MEANTFWSWILIILVVNLFLMVASEENRKEKLSKTMPFKWGYFSAWGVFLSGVAILLAYFFYRNEEYLFPLEIAAIFSGGSFLIIVGISMAQRKKWALIVGTIVQFNPVVWVINYFYFQNRWEELGQSYLSEDTDGSEGVEREYNVGRSSFIGWELTIRARNPKEAAKKFVTEKSLADNAKVIVKDKGNAIDTAKETFSVKKLKMDNEVQSSHPVTHDHCSQAGNSNATGSLYEQADTGNALAQFELGNKFFSGDGVPQDFLLAHKWFNLASANGNKEAQEMRTEVSKMLSKEQIVKAQEMARTWFESKK